MRCPGWIWRWLDRRGDIPAWASWLWPRAHFCPEMDDLLVVDDRDVAENCFCEIARNP